MNCSLRHVSHLPLLRLMAAFAWLMLVSMPMHGHAPEMAASMPAMNATAAVGHSARHCPHADGMAKSQESMNGCCDSTGTHGAMANCHCAATFGTALAAVNLIELLPMAPQAMRPLPGNASAPTIPDGPPLRPPAV